MEPCENELMHNDFVICLSVRYGIEILLTRSIIDWCGAIGDRLKINIFLSSST